MKIRPVFKSKGSLLLASVVLLTGSLLEARTWTDSTGRRIEAEFVRIFGNRVVLDWNGKPLQVPIDSLSAEDQAYLQEQVQGKRRADAGEVTTPRANAPPPAEQEKPGPPALAPVSADPFTGEGRTGTKASNFRREWKDKQGRTIVARFVEVEGDKIVLDRDGKISKVPFEKLSAVDQRFVHRLLKDRGLPDDLPGADSESLTRTEKNTTAPHSQTEEETAPALDANGEASGNVEPLLARTWTNIAGKKVRARLLRMNGANVVLAFRNKPMEIPFVQLSAEDQSYIRSRLTERGQQAQLAAVDTPRTPPAAAPPPVFAPPSVAAPPPMRHQDILADARRREEEFRRQLEEQRAQRQAEMERQRQEMAAQQQRAAEEHARMIASAAPPPGHGAPGAGGPGPYGPSSVQSDAYQCSKCKYVMMSVPGNYKCPMCQTVFSEIVEANGSRRTTGAKPVVAGIPVGGGYYLVPGVKTIAAVLFVVFSGIAAFLRKLFGGDRS